MTSIELLAPARTADIGIAAIDCGADAVYIAGPEFGARQAAGNSIEDLRRLCAYAHRFGARIYVTINTILYETEVEEARRLAIACQDAGSDALIVQDLSLLELRRNGSLHIPLHASTQCAIRTPGKAAFYAGLGYGRLVLERELSLGQIRAIHEALPSEELEFFVHGALCVCYSGECYLSDFITGRSANRGECAQPCRSRYDLEDSSGRILVRDKALLSLKDYNLTSRIGSLAEAGVCSFKIEGRLKNESYVRNVVRDCSLAMDAFIATHPGEYRRSSFGRVVSGFIPEPSKTFNRGYTTLFIDGKRGEWSSMYAPKSMGEEIGTVTAVKILGRDEIELSVRLVSDKIRLCNGDGFSFATSDGVTGFRGDVCSGINIRCKRVSGLKNGTRLFRNISVEFEKELERNACRRLIPAKVRLSFSWGGQDTVGKAGLSSGERGMSSGERGCRIAASAVSEDGREATISLEDHFPFAMNTERQKALFESQISKSSGTYSFSVESLDFADSTKGPIPQGSSSSVPESSPLPLVPASAINALRRRLSDELDKVPCNTIPIAAGLISPSLSESGFSAMTEDRNDCISKDKSINYKANVANSSAKKAYLAHGASNVGEAYEIKAVHGAELMRSKYCVRYELGLCHLHPDPIRARRHGILTKPPKGPLFLLNNGLRLRLDFDCTSCEMTVKSAD